VTLQKYRNALDEAELNLGWTKVYAQADGTVSNLQLSPGFASSGSAALALVNNQTDIVADFRERACAIPIRAPMPPWCLTPSRGTFSAPTSPAATRGSGRSGGR
jgi:hypothetical protein